VVEGRLNFDFATKMALVSEWWKWIRRVRDSSQAEKEDEWVWVEDVQEVHSETVVCKAPHPQAAHHDSESLPLVPAGHTLNVPPSSF
jgi:hypothetical protein